MHGHVSVRDGDRCWINARQTSRIGCRDEDVVSVRIADGRADGAPPSETPLHLAILRARPDVASVLHYHPLYATAFAVAGQPLVTAYNAGVIFGRTVPVFDSPDLIQDDERGDAVARSLGQGRGVLMRGHGATVVGDSVQAAVMAALFLEESARRLAATLPLGDPKPFSDDEIAFALKTLGGASVVEKTWDDAVERARIAGVLDDLS